MPFAGRIRGFDLTHEPLHMHPVDTIGLHPFEMEVYAFLVPGAVQVGIRAVGKLEGRFVTPRVFSDVRPEVHVGVAGIKRFNETDCEVKRMFVQPESRGFKIGQLLLTKCLDAAKELNYQAVKLDTADFMKSAIRLYTDNGFREIDAYRYNPHEEARYFELNFSKK